MVQKYKLVLLCAKPENSTMGGHCFSSVAPESPDDDNSHHLSVVLYTDYAALENSHADFVETVQGLGELAKKTLSTFDLYAGLARTEDRTLQMHDLFIDALQAVIAAADAIEKGVE